MRTEKNRKIKVVQSLLNHKLVAIVRLKTQAQIAQVLDSLVVGGVLALEITSNTPGFEEEIANARKQYPEILIGAGTITTKDLASKAIRSGAQFIVTPSTNLEIVTESHRYDIPVIMGATTPSEISVGLEAGADIIKLFPAGPLGLDYFKAVKAPFNSVPFFAVGGIGLENLQDWIKAGAAGVGIGSSLAKPIYSKEDRQANIAQAKAIIQCINN